MSRKEKAFFVIDVGVFGTDVGVAVNMSGRETFRKIKRWCTNPALLKEIRPQLAYWDETRKPHGISEGLMAPIGGGYVVLLDISHLTGTRIIGLVTHEMVHVTQYLLRRRRIPLTEDTEEVHAYLTEFLVDQALRAINSKCSVFRH